MRHPNPADWVLRWLYPSVCPSVRLAVHKMRWITAEQIVNRIWFFGFLPNIFWHISLQYYDNMQHSTNWTTGCMRHSLHVTRPALGPIEFAAQWVPRLFPCGEADGAWRWLPTPSSAQIKEKEEPYLQKIKVKVTLEQATKDQMPRWGTALLLF
jgi:hypothetical protein